MHHESLAPSGADRWMNCPGSVSLSQGQPDQSTPEADQGTGGHGIVTRVLRGEPNDIVDKWADEDLKYSIRHCLAYAQNLIGSTSVHTAVLTEFFLKSTTLDDFGGTVDLLMLDYQKGDIHVADWKFGIGYPVPPAQENLQLRCYALLALENFSWADTVTVHLLQPRVNDPTKHTYARDYLEEWRKEIAVVQQRRDFHAGTWCRFCPAKAVCPELRREAIATGNFEFVEPVDEQQVEAWKRIMEMTPMIRAMLDEVPRRMRDFMVKGEQVPGWKLVHAKGNRRWVLDDDKAVFKALRERGISKPKCTLRKLMSPAQLEKSGIEEEQFLDLVERPDKGYVAVPESDKRQAVEMENAADTFSGMDFETEENIPDFLQ